MRLCGYHSLEVEFPTARQQVVTQNGGFLETDGPAPFTFWNLPITSVPISLRKTTPYFREVRKNGNTIALLGLGLAGLFTVCSDVLRDGINDPPPTLLCNGAAVAPRPTGAESLSAMISQYFTGSMMPDRAIYMQQCKQFRCAPRENHAGRSKAVAKCSRATAFARCAAARPAGSTRSATHASAPDIRRQKFRCSTMTGTLWR